MILIGRGQMVIQYKILNTEDSSAVSLVRQELRKSRVTPRVTRSGRGKSLRNHILTLMKRWTIMK